MNDKLVIQQFLAENFNVIVEGSGPGTGRVLLVGLVANAHSGEIALHAMKEGSPDWNKPELMAEKIDTIATRHARGIVGGGQQQFTVSVCREGGKPTAVLTLARHAPPSITGANGSLSTEPPTQSGLIAMSQRMAEITLQGAVSKDQGATQVLLQVLREVREDKRAVQEMLSREQVENREKWIAIQKLVMEQNQAAMQMQFRGLQLQMGQKVVSLLPGFVNMMTGKELFPASQVDASMADVMVDSLSPEERQVLIASIQARPNGGPLATVLSDQLSKAQARKDAVAAEANKQFAAASSRPDLGELDAMGTAYRALKSGLTPPEPPPKRLPPQVFSEIDAAPEANANGSNGNAPPQTNGNGHKPPAEKPAVDKERVLAGLFAFAGDGAEMLITQAGMKNPEFAAELRQAYNEWKEGR